ncbi:MAG: hypothetical protein IJM31_03125, partial [Campylobacter sp.]|nr:hypothetical protein [Campylobacter sp.]
MPTIANLFNFATNIQDIVGIVKLEFGRFQAKLPLVVVSVEIVQIQALIRSVWGIFNSEYFLVLKNR